MSYEEIYESIRATVERAALDADEQTTIKNLRHMSHDATFEVMSTVAKAVRDLPAVDIESVLLILGERP